MKIKNIFQSFNFNNNKIIDVKSNTPTDAEHVANKGYVDVTTTYDTAAVTEQNNSPVFSWATGLLNLPLKALLDKLLFPIVNPIYTNPKFFNVKLTINSEFYNGKKISIFKNKSFSIRIDYEITASDRISGVTPKLIVTTSTGSVEYNGTLTSDTAGYIQATFNFTDIVSITLRKIFQECTVIKQDNYGTNYIPTDFTFDYNLDLDILERINKCSDIYNPMIYRKINSNEVAETIFNTIQTNDVLSTPGMSSSLSSFIKNNNLTINGNDNIYLVAIPDLLSNSNLKLHIGTDNSFDFDISMMKSNLLVSDNKKTLTYYGQTIPYYFGLIDLGSFESATNINFQFILFKTN